MSTHWYPAFFVVFACLTSLSSPGCAQHTTVHCRFDAFYGVRYRTAPKLLGCASTARVVRYTLAQRYSSLETGHVVEDGTPEDLISFLTGLPTPEANAISFVYLGSQQGPDGSWLFANGQRMDWPSILKRLPNWQPSRLRVIAIDACYASALLRVDGWREAFPGPILFASNDRELTFELNLPSRRPIDFKRRAPLGFEWSKNALPKWDGRITFLGFAWINAAAEGFPTPTAASDWTAFFSQCAKQAERFRPAIGKRYGSTLLALPQIPPSPDSVPPDCLEYRSVPINFYRSGPIFFCSCRFPRGLLGFGR
jgi:hypothetical protein